MEEISLFAGTNDSTIHSFKASPSLCARSYSVDAERFAFIEGITDILIQHLETDQRVRIRCRDVVRGINLFKHRLGVTLKDRINIYEIKDEADSTDMHYKIKVKIQKRGNFEEALVLSEGVALIDKNRFVFFFSFFSFLLNMLFFFYIPFFH